MEVTESSHLTRHGSVPARKIIVVDDHPAIRHGLSALLADEPDFEVCAQAGDGDSGLRAIREHSPHAVVLDLSLPDQEGMAVLETIRREFPHLPVLVISMHDDSVIVLRALKAGARGYIAKAEAADEVAAGLRKVLHGDMYLSQRFSHRLIFQMLRGRSGRNRTPIETLTARESEVLHHIGEGLGTREIAAALGISIKTVETHRGHIKDKFGFETPDELRRFAAEWVEQKK